MLKTSKLIFKQPYKVRKKPYKVRKNPYKVRKKAYKVRENSYKVRKFTDCQHCAICFIQKQVVYLQFKTTKNQKIIIKTKSL